MLTDPVLRSQVDALWDKLWAGGLPNPLDAIEQLSFLIFLKRLDEREQDAERAARGGCGGLGWRWGRRFCRPRFGECSAMPVC
jgi:hypothetical protein